MTSLAASSSEEVRRLFYTIVVVLAVCVVALLYVAYWYMPPEERADTPTYLSWMQTQRLDGYVDAGNFRLHYLHEGKGEPVILYLFLPRWRQLDPRATIVEIDQAGHLVYEDQPEQVNRLLLRFLAPYAEVV